MFLNFIMDWINSIANATGLTSSDIIFFGAVILVILIILIESYSNIIFLRFKLNNQFLFYYSFGVNILT